MLPCVIYFVQNWFERIPTRCWQPLGWLTVSPQRASAWPGVKSGAAGSFVETDTVTVRTQRRPQGGSQFVFCLCLVAASFDKRWAVGQVEWSCSTDKSPGLLHISDVCIRLDSQDRTGLGFSKCWLHTLLWFVKITCKCCHLHVIFEKKLEKNWKNIIWWCTSNNKQDLFGQSTLGLNFTQTSVYLSCFGSLYTSPTCSVCGFALEPPTPLWCASCSL